MAARVDDHIRLLLDDARARTACVVSHDQSIDRALIRRVVKKDLVSPLPRLYVDASHWKELDPVEQTLLVIHGLHELHGNWVFSGTTAAVAHGLSVSHSKIGAIEIVDAHGGRRRHFGTVHTRYVAGDEPVAVNGVSATSLSRTVFDCSRDLPLRDALAIADSALKSGRLTKQQLIDYVEHNAKGSRNITKARLVASLADGRSGSGGESIARAAMYEHGFAMPDLQVEALDPVDGGSYYADFSWHLPTGEVVFGELDGGEKYVDPEMSRGNGVVWALRQERLRESRLTAGCDAVVRFSPTDVEDAYRFDRILTSFGIPREREALISIPDGPVGEEVPLEAYGI